jgi:hypothetical protein
MNYKEKLAVGVVCLLALATMSCQAAKEAQEKSNAVKTAVTFYKGLEDPTPATEQVMELKEYRMYGYPALIHGSLGTRWGVEKLQGESEGFQVEIPFWCQGKTAAGAEVKLRRKLLVQVAANPAAEGGLTVTKFKFHGDEELSSIRQFFTWLLWMFLAPVVFLLVIMIFTGGSQVAFMVAQLMGLPIQIYVSYLCFGSAWKAGIAMGVWVIFQGVMASKRAQS